MYGRRVVITGIGAVSCVGNNVLTMWDSLVNGRSGIDYIKEFDTTDYKTKFYGKVRDLDMSPVGNEKELRRMDTYSIFALVASLEAIKDAGLPEDFRSENSPINPEEVGVCISSGIGGIQTVEKQVGVLLSSGPNRISPFMIPMMIPDMACGHVSIRCGAKGPNFTILSACASSCHAIGESYHMVARGDADMMITGGSESSLSPICISGFSAMKALSCRNDDPKAASRPFDKDRDGFVMQEGSGILILEEYEHAVKRGAKIYAEVIGYGATGDGYHITSPAPGGEGAARAFQRALKNAGIAPEQVDYVNAHGTSTHLNDLYETQQLKTVFGDALSKISVSSTKSVMGHTLGAAGALETIVCCKAIETGIIPPTINYTTPDPECDINCTPNTAIERKIDVAINTNLGFGGHNGVLVIRRCK